jgi:hypothetical protein
MNRAAIFISGFLAGVFPILASAMPENTAASILESAIRQMGGKSRLESVSSIRILANAERNLLEQSIRPEWPWMQDFYRFDLTLDFTRQRLRAVERRYGHLGVLEPLGGTQPSIEYWVQDGVAVAKAGEEVRPYSQALVQDAMEWNAMNPLRVLVTAQAAGALRLDQDVTFQGVPHRVVTFQWRGNSASLLIDAKTRLPSAVTWVSSRERDLFWNTWGDVTTRIRFNNWNLRPNGIRVPMQWVVERNGLLERSLELTSLEVNPPNALQDWTVPDSVSRQIAAMPARIADLPLGLPNDPPKEIAPGVVRIPGRWDVTLVRQGDGVVVIEAPISAAYSERVIAEAARRFPNEPIKAVVTTSDAWPHIAGLRAYAARKVPIYVLDLNLPLVERLLSARFSIQPDALALHPAAPDLHAVSARMRLGIGDNPIELIPLRTPVGERQMLALLGNHHMAYTSDLVQPASGGEWYAPQMLSELSEVFSRERLDVRVCFGMHYAPKAWSEMHRALTDYLEETP